MKTRGKLHTYGTIAPTTPLLSFTSLTAHTFNSPQNHMCHRSKEAKCRHCQCLHQLHTCWCHNASSEVHICGEFHFQISTQCTKPSGGRIRENGQSCAMAGFSSLIHAYTHYTVNSFNAYRNHHKYLCFIFKLILSSL